MNLPAKLSSWVVNAFVTDGWLTGNPAAVCILPEWPEDAVLQALATQHNLSETAFLVAHEGGWHLRWFTPGREVDLCGHATLAAASVLFEIGAATEVCRFFTRSGELRVRGGDDGLLWMDFPARPAVLEPATGALEDLFGPVRAVGRSALDYLLVEVAAEETVRDFVPELEPLRAIEAFGIILTAPSQTDGFDFVSRFFVPRAGILEDPVTGSAHCSLFPWWAERVGRPRLRAWQCSPRGGWIDGELQDDRVLLGGRARLYASGTIWTEGS